MVLTDRVPESVPDEIFSPRRLLKRDPLFLTERQGLSRVASSLCQQLRAVNRQISDALILSADLNEESAYPSAVKTHPPKRFLSERIVTPGALKSFRIFKDFSRNEISRLLRLTRCWELPKGTIIFTENSSGSSCYFIVEGLVEVSTGSRGAIQLLARLGAGSVLGQVSVVDGATRSATCSTGSTTAATRPSLYRTARPGSRVGRCIRKWLAVLPSTTTTRRASKASRSECESHHGRS
jgi:hypothetical protein